MRAVKDAFIILKGAVRIEYSDGDTWAAEFDDDTGELKEHPVLPTLRAESMNLILETGLEEERAANTNMRKFLCDLEDMLTDFGHVKGEETLTWLKNRLTKS